MPVPFLGLNFEIRALIIFLRNRFEIEMNWSLNVCIISWQLG